MTLPGITIAAETMTSPRTGHTARLAEVGATERWRVSWLPGRRFTRNQAITALTIAEIVATCDLLSDSPWWPHLDSWAAELGLTGPDAVVRATAGCLPACPPRGDA